MSNQIKQPIRIEQQSRKNGGPRLVYIFKCLNCDNEVKIRKSEISRRKGTCISCSQRKRPFESIYNGIFNDHRKLKVELTYEQFLEFTLENKCHYCFDNINWKPYTKCRAYFLDRKDNNIGYFRSNLVVCCTRCNMSKSDKFTYEEWYGMTKFLRDRKV